MIQKTLLYVLILLSLTVSSAFSQNITARLDLGKRDAHPNFILHSPVDNGLVTLGAASTISSRNVALIKYDGDFSQEWKKTVLSQNGRKNLDFMTVIGDNILVFVSEYKPKAKVIETYYYRYNLAGEQLEEQALLSVSPNQKAYRTDLKYVLSSNKRTLLCYRNLENRQEGEAIQYFVFNETGQQTNNGEIALKYPDNRFRITWVRVSNSGNVYFLGKHYKANKVRDAEDYQYLMFRYNSLVQSMEEFEIQLGDRFVNDLVFKIDRNEHIYIAGFYSNRGTDQIKGILLQQIDSVKISPQKVLLYFQLIQQ